MFVLNSVKQNCQNYLDEIPTDTFHKAARSALYSFAISWLTTSGSNNNTIRNIIPPVYAAGAAALASLIYAVTTPFFNRAFEDNRLLLHRETVKWLFNVVVSSSIINYLMTGKVNLLALKLIPSISCNFILSELDTVPTVIDYCGSSTLARQVRFVYKFLGVDAVPGSSSIFLNFGEKFV